ncbi:MAG: DUF1761 domain-containing protein [Gammaproteobacteria bacterium]|nr:DUF1761 domain-containing protein [Gammaproteobacteria bacterium]
MGDVNWLAVSVAAIATFVIGGLWYSPLLFYKKWAALVGMTPEKQGKGHPALTYGVSFILSFAAAFVFSLFLGANPEPGFAVGAGISAGLFWVAGSFGINYLFEQKPLSLFLINGGYHTLQFTAYGLVFGLM